MMPFFRYLQAFSNYTITLIRFILSLPQDIEILIPNDLKILIRAATEGVTW